MALHLGNSEKLKIILDGVIYRLSVFSEKPFINGVLLFSSDDYILKDANGIYLTVQEIDSALKESD